MNLAIRQQSFEEIASAVASAEERRTHDRLKVMKTMHISGINSSISKETATVVDISRQGIYFTVRSSHVHVGMEITLTIPSLGFEGMCRVVRIEDLPNGDVGVGGIVLGW
jgi:hypothetical protein